MRFPKPFFRKSKKTWYLQLGRRQVSLGKNRDEAFRRYRELLLHEQGAGAEPSRDLTVAEACDLFLEWCLKHTESTTREWYQQYLQDFCNHFGNLRTTELKPFHVSRWVDMHRGWGPASQRAAIGTVKRVFSWAEGEGLVSGNPVRKVRKPRGRRRERILSPAEREKILAAIRDQAFKDFVIALQETGCRPSEVATIAAAEVRLEDGTWVLAKHKTARKTGQPRTIFLTRRMIELSRTLTAKNPTGPLFRNTRGRRWTRNAIRCRFIRLRKKLPELKGVVCYTYRHTYATDALVNGVGVAEVAELLGHKDLAMIQEHYGHLAEKRDHLKRAAERAVRPLAS